jgi:hypothetical protein
MTWGSGASTRMDGASNGVDAHTREAAARLREL